MVSESEARMDEYIEGRRLSQGAIIKEINDEKDKEIEQYKHTLEHDTKEIKLLTAEIDQKDEEIERLMKVFDTILKEDLHKGEDMYQVVRRIRHLAFEVLEKSK